MTTDTAIKPLNALVNDGTLTRWERDDDRLVVVYSQVDDDCDDWREAEALDLAVDTACQPAAIALGYTDSGDGGCDELSRFIVYRA
ncbi:MAG: hypothetical protein ACO3G4_16475 [Opitutaceae bacterium]